jgi:hypothetical protein
MVAAPSSVGGGGGGGGGVASAALFGERLLKGRSRILPLVSC